MIEMICPKCGKLFIPAPLHRFRDEGRVYCSWTCYNHRDQKTYTLRGRKPQRVAMCDRTGTEIQEFQSALKASELTGYDYKGIQFACNSSTTFRGYLWKYKEKI